MKFNEIINTNSFDMDTLVYNGTMYEMPSKEELKSLLNEVNGNIFKHMRNTNITYPSKIDNTLYDITYIDKKGYMFSEMDLNIVELTIRLNELKDKIEKNYLNIFKSINRISLK